MLISVAGMKHKRYHFILASVAVVNANNSRGNFSLYFQECTAAITFANVHARKQEQVLYYSLPFSDTKIWT